MVDTIPSDAIEAARLLDVAKTDSSIPEEQLTAALNTLSRHFPGGVLNDDQLGAVAMGQMPEGRVLATSNAAVGGDNMGVDDVASMNDRDLAGRNSTVSKEDIALAEMHARSGNYEAAENVAAGAADLDETLDRAKTQREMTWETTMNGVPGESPEETRERLEKEEQEKEGPGLGDKLIAMMGFGAAFAFAKETVGPQLSFEANQEAAIAGTQMFPHIADFANLGQGISGPQLQAALEQGVTQVATLPSLGQGRGNAGMNV